MLGQNIPNTNQKTILARMKVKSFTSPENPTPKQLQEFDNGVNKFLNTIDNTKRFLNGRNSYSLGNRIYTLIWYLEKMADKPVTTPFGDKVKPGQPIIKADKEDIKITKEDAKKDNTPEKKTA